MYWFATSKGRKVIHIKMESKLGKQIFAGPSLTMDHRENFDQTCLAGFITHLFILTYDDVPLPGKGPLSKFFLAVGQKVKSSSRAIFLSLKNNQLKTINI